MIPDMNVFLSSIREWFQNPDRRIGDNIELECAESSPDGVAIILIRLANSPRLYGYRYFLAEFAALTNARDSTALAWEAIGEISEPSGAGKHLVVDWANGLTAEPSTVRWIGESSTA